MVLPLLLARSRQSINLTLVTLQIIHFGNVVVDYKLLTPLPLKTRLPLHAIALSPTTITQLCYAHR
jgi:hypothetical protein